VVGGGRGRAGGRGWSRGWDRAEGGRAEGRRGGRAENLGDGLGHQSRDSDRRAVLGWRDGGANGTDGEGKEEGKRRERSVPCAVELASVAQLIAH
jgi:hypothetical protein